MDLGGGECSSEEHLSLATSVLANNSVILVIMEIGISITFWIRMFSGLLSVCSSALGLFRVISGFLPGQNFLGVCCLWGMCLGFFGAFSLVGWLLLFLWFHLFVYF